MEKLFKQLVPKQGEPISVDRVMADLQKDKVQAQPVTVKNDPPQIFYSSKSAILLMKKQYSRLPSHLLECWLRRTVFLKYLPSALM